MELGCQGLKGKRVGGIGQVGQFGAQKWCHWTDLHVANKKNMGWLVLGCNIITWLMICTWPWGIKVGRLLSNISIWWLVFISIFISILSFAFPIRIPNIRWFRPRRDNQSSCRSRSTKATVRTTRGERGTIFVNKFGLDGKFSKFQFGTTTLEEGEWLLILNIIYGAWVSHR